MAVMQTPQGRIIGLVPEKEQPKTEPVEQKAETVKRPGRPAKK